LLLLLWEGESITHLKELLFIFVAGILFGILKNSERKKRKRVMGFYCFHIVFV
jgi:hypothetical protein